MIAADARSNFFYCKLYSTSRVSMMPLQTHLEISEQKKIHNFMSTISANILHFYSEGFSLIIHPKIIFFTSNGHTRYRDTYLKIYQLKYLCHNTLSLRLLLLHFPSQIFSLYLLLWQPSRLNYFFFVTEQQTQQYFFYSSNNNLHRIVLNQPDIFNLLVQQLLSSQTYETKQSIHFMLNVNVQYL